MEKIVFTNGCFDLIHPGHIELLKIARSKGTKLIVGINSDQSVKSIKGADRPFMNQNDRKNILESIKYVDEVYIFEELTPENLIKELKPDVLVKGGDWKESEIIGADFLKNTGGEVFSIPLKKGFSTTKIAEKLNKTETKKNSGSGSLIETSLRKHLKTIETLLEEQTENIKKCGELIIETFKNKNKILLCGNGGSAADAQHIAAEFVGRFETERVALPAIALTTDTSALTAITNDYDFSKIFSRQIAAISSEGDLLIAISTSGNSENILQAVMEARKRNCRIIGLTGKKGKKLASLCDVSILVNSDRTANIQEAHITIAHILCEMIDQNFTDTL